MYYLCHWYWLPPRMYSLCLFVCVCVCVVCVCVCGCVHSCQQRVRSADGVNSDANSLASGASINEHVHIHTLYKHIHTQHTHIHTLYTHIHTQTYTYAYKHTHIYTRWTYTKLWFSIQFHARSRSVITVFILIKRHLYTRVHNEIIMLFRLIGLIPKSTTKASLYGRLSMTLVRVNVKALLSRANTLDGNWNWTVHVDLVQ